MECKLSNPNGFRQGGGKAGEGSTKVDETWNLLSLWSLIKKFPFL